MRPRSFEVTTLVTEVSRYESADADHPSGWWIGLLLGSETKLRLFFPESLFETSLPVGVSANHEAVFKTFVLEPALVVGQPLSIEIPVPLLDPS